MSCSACLNPACQEDQPGCIVAHIQHLTNKVAALERDRFATNLFIHPVLNNTGSLFRYEGNVEFEQITSDGCGGFWALCDGGILHRKIELDNGIVELETADGLTNVVRGKIGLSAFSTRDGKPFYAIDTDGNVYIFDEAKKDFVSALENSSEWKWTSSPNNPKILVRTPIYKPKISGKVRKMVTTFGGHYILDETTLTAYSRDFSKSNIVFHTGSDVTDFFVVGDNIYIPNGLVFVCTSLGASKDVIAAGKGPSHCVFVENNLMVVGHNDRVSISRTDGKLAKEIRYSRSTCTSDLPLQNMIVDKNGRIILHFGGSTLLVVV